MALVDHLIEREPELETCRPTVEKEFLHMEILAAFRKTSLLSKVVFKGGTCLRLCRGGERVSEDLDFSAGEHFDRSLIDDLEAVLVDQIGATYGLHVTVRARTIPENARMAGRWMARIVTRPSPTGGSSNIGVQRIKIEVSDQDERSDAVALQASLPYSVVAGLAPNVLVNCVPVTSTIRDKLIALPMSVALRQNPRYRDIWDIFAFRPRGGAVGRTVRAARQAAQDRMAIDEFEAMVDGLIVRLPKILESAGFESTLRRFLPRRIADDTIGDATFREAVCNALQDLFGWVRDPRTMSPIHEF